MIKHIYALLICLIFPFMLAAQGRGDVSKELQEYKIKYLAQEMDLKPDQQTRFIEVYTRMSNEKQKIFRAAHDVERKVRSDNSASSADYQRANEAMSQAKIREGQIDKKYDAEFKKFLTDKQIYKMKEAEKKFREKLKQLRNKKRR